MLRILIAFLFLITPLHARITPLGSAPDWKELDGFQETITREEFKKLLEEVYAPNGASDDWITIGDNSALIKTRNGSYDLRFAATRADARAVPSFWQPRSAIPAPPAGKPLAGVTVAIDPGHIGGKWAKMEERWFRIGNTKPVTEGDMTLLVAKKIAGQLTDLGAKVYLTRSKPSPVTSLRPEKLTDEARASLRDRDLRATSFSLQKETERLFYRVGEIRRRAKLVNESIKPDIVLCLHFNAEAWGNPDKPELVDVSHLHFLITGAWNAEELSYEDQRFEMLVKMLSRAYPEEFGVTKAVAKTMARDTRLPPYNYTGSNAVRVEGHPFIYARNLLANRLFRCPVVYIEPYVMNNRHDFARIQAGDYEGTRNFAGIPRKSIYREYADSVVEGLVDYYSQR
ncbi:MAG: hypothetical protein Fur0032_09410 [Terrimicrobiaceae bacterium]